MRKYKKTKQLIRPAAKVILCFYFFSGLAIQGLFANTDSLRNIIRTGSDDSLSIDACYQLGNYYNSIHQFDSASFYYSEFLAAANPEWSSYKTSIKKQAIVLFFQAEYEKSVEMFDQLRKWSLQHNDSVTLTSAYNGLGTVYMEIGSRTKDTSMYAKSLYYHQLAISTKINLGMNERDLAISFNNIGNLYSTQSKFPKAIEHYEKALNYYQKSGDSTLMAGTLDNIASCYDLDSVFDKAEEYYLKAINIRKAIKDTMGLIKGYNNLIEHQLVLNKFDNILPSLHHNLSLAASLGLKRDQVFGYRLLTVYYDKTKKYDSAYHYLRKHQDLKDTLFNENSQKTIAELETKYEIAQNKHKLEISDLKVQQQNAVIHRKNILIYAIIAILLIALVFSYFLYKNVQAKKAANQQLEIKNALVEEQHEEITSSIQYARKIQEAILPSPEYFHQHLKSAFVFYQPKEIVSGDFYWMEERNGHVYFAVVDCTGHGVPGAFMSMVGYNGLNKAINELNLTEPGQILDALHEFVYDSLHHNKENTLKDGMDITLCRYSPSNQMLWFAGAYNSLFVVRNKEEVSIEEIKADKQPIGSYKINRNPNFTTHSLQLTADTTIYLTSDGYLDQFGGPKNKKFMRTRFKRMLVDINEASIPEQRELIKSIIENWKGKEEQIDDICVVGFRPDIDPT